jgi:hypothetical protein
MVKNQLSCTKCKGKRIFHIGDAIAFSGDRSFFSLAGLANAANIAGLRVHGANDKITAVITKSSISSSESLKKAKMRGILILSPDDFQKEIKRICEGNVPSKENPRISTLVGEGSKIFAWGLGNEQEKILDTFCKNHKIARWKVRKPSLTFAVTTRIHINSGNSKILRSMGVPVYDFNKILKTLNS